jgi:beta-1,4-N-acetylglucosaminyltransferase
MVRMGADQIWLRTMLVLLTVGSTRFDALVQTALSVPVLRALHRRKYRNLIVQCGNSSFELASALRDSTVFTLNREGVDIELWTFKPSLQADYRRADLVISHAGTSFDSAPWNLTHVGIGSGTILDVLRLGKPLIVIPNTTLLDDHQQQLASSLAELGHLVTSTSA